MPRTPPDFARLIEVMAVEADFGAYNGGNGIGDACFRTRRRSRRIHFLVFSATSRMK
jgi:hypothetical protein